MSLWSKVSRRAGDAMHKARFRRSLRHLHGPTGVSVAEGGIVAVILVRNGMFYLDEFLAHYRGLGVDQFVFCDNGSTDGTVERLTSEPDTVILQSLMTWGEIENDFRRYAAETFARDRWCLIVDMDEMFEFDGADMLGLRGLTGYMDAEGHTALVAQMLEMYPDRPIRETARMPFDEVLNQFHHYDLSDIDAHDYHDPNLSFAWYLERNRLSSEAVQILFGGARSRVFGEHCCLTKHPLVKVKGDLEPAVHPHCAVHSRVADFTALIRHYKFANDPVARDADTAARAAIPHGEDRARLRRFDHTPDLTLYAPVSRRFEGLAPLQEAGFLVTSPRFEAYRAALATAGRT